MVVYDLDILRLFSAGGQDAGVQGAAETGYVGGESNMSGGEDAGDVFLDAGWGGRDVTMTVLFIVNFKSLTDRSGMLTTQVPSQATINLLGFLSTSLTFFKLGSRSSFSHGKLPLRDTGVISSNPSVLAWPLKSFSSRRCWSR